MFERLSMALRRRTGSTSQTECGDWCRCRYLGIHLRQVSCYCLAGMDEVTIEFYKKIVTEGREAGLTLNQIFELLETGMYIGTILNLIELRLASAVPGSSHWIM